MNLIKLFETPKIIGVVADQNEGKSNLIYHLVDELRQYKCRIFAYGLRSRLVGVNEIYSVEELEQIRNSIVILDEFDNLFDLDNRKITKQIEKSIRLIFHNNNVLLLCGLGENFKKFVSAKLHYLIFKKITFADLVNGSRVKSIIMQYNGLEKGMSVINIPKNECIIFDGNHYTKLIIPLMKDFDSKAENVPIIVQKNYVQKCAKAKI